MTLLCFIRYNSHRKQNEKIKKSQGTLHMIKNKMKKLVLALTFAFTATAIAPTISEAATFHSKAISVAKSNLGVKYQWGGMSTRGFDCSGLVKYSYGKAGKTLPRTAAQMYKTGSKVTSMNNLQPGDLMFFSPSKVSAPTHVAIYLGGGKMIQSASSKGVSISTTNNTYWKPKFIGAKRL